MKKLITLLFITLVSFESFAHSVDKDLRSRNIESVYPGHKKIILTFDDGPKPQVTPFILDILAKYRIKATFFVLGRNAAKYPNLMRRIQSEGHTIANHSYDHENIANYRFYNITRRLEKAFFGAHKAMLPYTDGSGHFFFRAPQGAWQSKAAKIINKTAVGKSYIGPVLWDIGGSIRKNAQGVYTEAADWGCWSKGMSVDQCLQGYLNRTEKRQGGVVLLHDIHTQSISLLERLIPSLIQRGYSFINLNQIGLN